MHKSIIALGIESSCDDTSIGVIKVTRKDNILVSEKLGLVTLSQEKLHKGYGGVVPEIAARAHSERVDTCFKKAFKENSIKLDDIDIICVTKGPGLIGGLISGINLSLIHI